ncbi:hypothetical protein BC833DRAFT_625173 [Globomyces pollinis-pini]|nr:hypothetical protein BC833DRAFT_625173 [Globomyces pollinis-pini]
MVNTVTMQTKLIDFGSCISTKAVDPPFNGSEYYGPPEAIGGDPFDVSKSESYSFGMLAFSIFYGAKLPFAFNLPASERDIGKSMEEFEAILNEERPFHISPNAKLLIKTLMEVDVNIRPAFDGITQLKCFNSEDSDLTLLPEPVLPTEGRKGVEEGSSRSVFGRYWDNCRAMIRSISCFSRNRD